MTKVTFEVTPSAGIVGYWLRVGEKAVALTNHKGSLNLRTGQRHVLIWWMSGNGGASIKIRGSDTSGETVVEVKESKIPADENEGAGARRFDL